MTTLSVFCIIIYLIISTYQCLLCSFMHELIHKSREMFTKWRAQRWWTENYEKVMELYNVQKFNSQAAPLPSTPRSDHEVKHPSNHLSGCFNFMQHAFLSYLPAGDMACTSCRTPKRRITQRQLHIARGTYRILCTNH